MKLRSRRGVERDAASATEDVLEQHCAVAIVSFLSRYPEVEEGGGWPGAWGE